MKKIIVGFSVAVSLLVSASMLQAQVADVSGGSVGLELSSSYKTMLTGQGVTLVQRVRVSKGVDYPFLAAEAGAFELSTGFGIVATTGHLEFKTAASELKIEAVIFENLGAGPVLTGQFFLNGVYVGHNVVYMVTGSNPLKTPMALGPYLDTSIPIVVSPYLSSVLKSSFGITVPASTSAGDMWLDLGLIAID